MKFQALLVGFGMLSMSALGGETLFCGLTSDTMGDDNYVMVHKQDIDLGKRKGNTLVGKPRKDEAKEMAELKVASFRVNVVFESDCEHLNLQMDMTDGTRLFSNTILGKIEKGMRANLGLPFSVAEVAQMKVKPMPGVKKNPGELLKANLVCFIQ